MFYQIVYSIFTVLLILVAVCLAIVFPKCIYNNIVCALSISISYKAPFPLFPVCANAETEFIQTSPFFSDSHFVIEPYNMFQGFLNFMHGSESSSTFIKLEILILNSNRKQLCMYSFDCIHVNFVCAFPPFKEL